MGYVEASRGCKHLCRHCPIPPVYGGRFFVVPPDVVLADVRQCVEAGATHVTIGDPDFLNGPRHALAVARALHAEFPQVTFDFTAKVEHLLRHRAMLPELRALGCAFVVSAVESLSDTVLLHLDKGHTRADVVELVRLMREAGHPAPAHLGGVHALDDARRLPGDARLRRRARTWWTRWTRSSTRSGSWCRRARSWSTTRRCAPTSAPWSSGRSPTRWTHPDPRMDALQAEVARLVEAAAEAHADEAVTFDRVRAAVDGMAGAAGRSLPAGRARPDRRASPAPDRALVLLSGAHRGPVGPPRTAGRERALTGASGSTWGRMVARRADAIRGVGTALDEGGWRWRKR